MSVNENTIAGLYAELVDLDKHHPMGIDPDMMKKLFYSGAGAVLAIMAKNSNLGPEAGSALMEGLFEEFELYQQEVYTAAGGGKLASILKEVLGAVFGDKVCESCPNKDKCDHVGKPEFDGKPVQSLSVPVDKKDLH